MYKTKVKIPPVNTSITPEKPIYLAPPPPMQNGKKLVDPYAVSNIALPGNTPITPAVPGQLFDSSYIDGLSFRHIIGPSTDPSLLAPTEPPPPIPNVTATGIVLELDQ